MGPHHKALRGRFRLRIREVHIKSRAGDLAIPHVPYDPNDPLPSGLSLRVYRPIDRQQTLPDRVVVGPQPPGGTLSQNHDRFAVGPVGNGEEAAGFERDPECGEVVGGDNLPIHQGIVPGSGRAERLSLEDDRRIHADAAVLQRPQIRRGRAATSGNDLIRSISAA